MSVDFLMTGSGTITLFARGRQFTVPPSHANHDRIKEAIKQGLPAEKIVPLCDVPRAVASFTGGAVEVKDGEVFYRGEALHNSITRRILDFVREGLPFAPMVKFLENLMENPSMGSVRELYDFLEHHHLPITSDGHFLAYKRVKEDWTDFYSGTVENRVGSVIKMPRNQVDDDRRHDCSHGFHVGAIEYVRTFNSGGHVIICKVNPKDVVSVPLDHGCTKLRACRYEVIGEYQGDLSFPLYEATREGGYKEFDAESVRDEDDPDLDDEDLEDDEIPVCEDCDEYVTDCTCE